MGLFHVIRKYSTLNIFALAVLIPLSAEITAATASEPLQADVSTARSGCVFEESLKRLAQPAIRHIEWSHEQYVSMTQSMTRDLVSRFHETTSVTAGITNSLKSLPDRIRNKVFTILLRRRVSAKRHSDSLTEGLIRAEKSIQSLAKGPLRLLVKGSLMDAAESFIRNRSQSLRWLQANKRLVEDVERDFTSDWEQYKRKYGAQYFTESGKEKALMNVTAMRLFAHFDGFRDPSTYEAVNAIALLHPVTDELMDAGLLRRETVGKITLLLQGKAVKPDQDYERLVFDLINHIYERYPRDKHPMVDWLMNDLWMSQIKSAGQKVGASSDAINRMTIEKGGLSTSVFAYISLGRLTPHQYDFFYRGGSLYQWLDDLSDMRADIHDGIETLWTSGRHDPKKLSDNLSTVVQIKNEITSNPKYTQDFQDAAGIRNFFSMSFYTQYLTAAAINADLLHRSPYHVLGGQIGLSASQVEKGTKLILNLYGAVNDRRKDPFATMLERFLLQGKTTRDVAGPLTHEAQTLFKYLERDSSLSDELRKALGVLPAR